MFGITTIMVTALLATLVASATEIHHIIHETRSDRYYVYRRDGSVYGRFDNYETLKHEIESKILSARAGAICTPLTYDQAKTLPGWSKIERYAKDHFGTGDWDIVVNPPDYPDSSATVCIDSEVVQVQTTGTPSCHNQESTIQGRLDNTNGTVKLSYMEGFKNEATWSVTQSTSIGASMSFSVEIGIPAIGSAGVSSTATAEFINEVGSSFTTSVNHQVTQEVIIASVPGKDCHASLKTSTCNSNGLGKARMVANGFVWFYYDDKRAPVNNPKGSKHYRWAVNIAAAVHDKDERSSWLAFVGSMKTSTNSQYQAHC